MASRKPFPRGDAEGAECLKIREDILFRDAFVGRDQSEDRVQRADAKKTMSRNRETLMTWIFGLKNHMAADLVNNDVAPVLAQMLRQIISSEIPRQLHQREEEGLSKGEALVPNQVQPDTTRGGVGGIKKITTNGVIDSGSHRGPVVSLSYDRLRQAFSDIAAVCFLRHFEDQLFHRRNFIRPFPG